jgi:hypothetical protein
MPLYATALFLEEDATNTAIVDVDAIGFDREWTSKIISAIEALAGIPAERIRFSCTHTHSGPNTFRMGVISEGLEMAQSYLATLPHLIAGAVWQARQNLQPVRCVAGSGQCTINVNRRLRAPNGELVMGRNWQGITDPAVRVVRLDDYQENPVATIVHYACHPTVMAWQNQLFTPDFPGVTKKVVEDQLGGVCLFLQGATGNLMPRRGYTGDVRVYHRLGAILGLEAARVAMELESLPRREVYQGVLQSGAAIVLYDDEAYEPAAPLLRVARRLVPMPARPLPAPDQLQAQRDACLAELNRLRKEGSEEEIRAATARATQIGWQADYARQYSGAKSIEWEMQCIRIGQIALLSVPGEPFIEIAQQIVARSPFPHTLFSGYSNGGFGYIPTREAFAEGGYEPQATPFAPEAADVLVEEGIQLLRKIAAD